MPFANAADFTAMLSNDEARTTVCVFVDARSQASTRPTASSSATYSTLLAGSHAAKKSASASSRDGKPSMIFSPICISSYRFSLIIAGKPGARRAFRGRAIDAVPYALGCAFAAISLNSDSLRS